MRDPDPQPDSDQFENFRYHDVDDGDRYHDMVGRDVPCAPYNFRAVTLEEEANNGGWLPGARPTGPKPNDLFTTSMRGEPGWDDDPQFNNGEATVTHPPAK